MIKINILYKMTDNPTGGGNQFLKNLKKWLIENGYYAEVGEAGVIIFNSHQYINEVIKLKRKYPDKLFIHRVAGPIRIQTSKDDKRDNIVHIANKYLGDATIFQSQYSMTENINYNMPRNKFEKIICNAADADIFNAAGKRDMNSMGKIRLIATSWSNNMNKGFDTYQYLDETLDWSKYAMTFIGNSPVAFKHIVHKLPIQSVGLAKELKQHDIYISASRKDPCSNSVIEALSCGLPALCLKDGGHPELVKNGGLLFECREEIPELLNKLVNNYEKYRQNIQIPSMETIGNEYVSFAETVKESMDRGLYSPKKIGFCIAKHVAWQTKKWSR